MPPAGPPLGESFEGLVLGRELYLRRGPERQAIRAEAIRELSRAGEAIDSRGLLISGAMIQGPLNLYGMQVPFPLVFRDCVFEAPLNLTGAHLPSLSLVDCVVPGVHANNLRVDRDLDLSWSRIEGQLESTASTSKRSALWLCESSVGGRFLAIGTNLLGPGGRALQADRMEIAGTVRFIHGFRAQGEMRMIGIRVGGSIDFTGAELSRPLDGLSLDLADARVQGSVFIIEGPGDIRPTVQGRIDLGNAQITGQFLMRSVRLGSSASSTISKGYAASRLVGGMAISAPKLQVDGDVTIEGDSIIQGGIDFSLSQFGRLWLDGTSQLLAPGDDSMNLANATVLAGLTFGPGLRSQGTLRLTGTRVLGNMDLRDTSWDSPNGESVIAAAGIEVHGDVAMQEIRTCGGHINLRSSRLGSALDLSGAQLINPKANTLTLHQASIVGSVRLTRMGATGESFRSIGRLVLTRTNVGGRVDMRNGVFRCPESSPKNRRADAIKMDQAKVAGGLFLAWQEASPTVDFTDAESSLLADRPEMWPGQIRISGMSYERIDNPRDDRASDPWDLDARLKWLSRQETFDRGSYEQAARVFRNQGYVEEAERILIASRVALHSAAKRRQAIWSARAIASGFKEWLSRNLLGHGYRPARVVWAIGMLTVAVLLSTLSSIGLATLKASDAQAAVYTVRRNGWVGVQTVKSIRDPKPVDTCGAIRCLNPTFFAIDTVVPLISLGQRSTWYPDPTQPWGRVMTWWLNLATVLGWILSSVYALSLARLARST